MNLKEFEYLSGDFPQKLIKNHLGDDPVEIAFRLPVSGPEKAWIVTQIRNLQRAQSKLPEYAEALCLLPSRALEQSTSSLAAQLKWEGLKGENFLDLTCGLGVDSFMLSHSFLHGTCLEKEAALAHITSWNFNRLGARNLSVLHAEAEAFVQNCRDQTFDLVYIDPDRRDASGNRSFLPKDCSPDVTALHDDLLRISADVRVKLSPLMDLTEGFRQLPQACRATVIATGGECREVLFQLTRNTISSKVHEAVFVKNNVFHRFEAEPSLQPECLDRQGEWYYEPDVSVYKAQISGAYLRHATGGVVSQQIPNGYGVSNELVPEFPGHIYKVEEVFPWKPAEIRKWLKQKGIERVNLTRKQFPWPLEQVRRELRWPEGGAFFLLLTRNASGAPIAVAATRYTEIG